MCGGVRDSGKWKEEKSAAVNGLNHQELESVFCSLYSIKYIK
jgi:hypothetical protein